MRKHAGFTLIEVMVVVGIIAVLAAIGYPAYSDYTRRGKIAEAISTLADTRAKMEQFFLDNRTYVGADAANLPCNATVLNAGKKHFTYACSNLSGSTYDVAATGAAADGMGGFTYTINAQNVRQTTAAPTGFAGTLPVNCWVTKKGGVC